jgi:hypothetical protein
MNHCLLLVLVVFACSLSLPVSAQTPKDARVTSTSANLRDIPSIVGGTEQEVAEDTIVKVLDEKVPWFVVRVGNRVGWMHGIPWNLSCPKPQALEVRRRLTRGREGFHVLQQDGPETGGV